MNFRSKYAEKTNEKGVLCVGLDPATPDQGLKESIPHRYLVVRGKSDAKLVFCFDIIDDVKRYASIVKPNLHFIADFSTEQHQELTEYARNAGLLTVKDIKLSDIGNSTASGIYHAAEQGYDAITYNPLLGNLEESVKAAKARDLGLIVLTLTSNPEGTKYFKGALVNGRPMYEDIAKEVKEFDADGMVVGATAHVTESDVKRIVELGGEDKVVLVTGVGTQGGDATKFKGLNVAINVGREIIYHPFPEMQAEDYAKSFADLIRQ